MTKILVGETGTLLEEPDYFGPLQFQSAIAERFPTLNPELQQYPKLLHVHMSMLASVVREAMSKNDRRAIQSVLEFLAEILVRDDVHPEIPNAVCISFITAAELRGPGVSPDIWPTVPAPIRQLLLEQAAREPRHEPSGRA